MSWAIKFFSVKNLLFNGLGIWLFGRPHMHKALGSKSGTEKEKKSIIFKN